MARRYILRELEQKHGDLESHIIGLLNKCGGKQHLVAAKLGVSQATISHFLTKHGYVAHVQYVKQGSKGA